MEEAEDQEAREEQEMVDELAEVKNSATVEMFRRARYRSPLNRYLLARDSGCVAYSRFLCQIAVAF